VETAIKGNRLNEQENNALSEREEQVLLYATKGFTDKEIARKLGISTATVLTYWMRIRNKLGGSNRAELVASAVRRDAQGEIELKQTENTQLLSEILRRMEAEDALRDKEERFRTLFNGGSDWILVYQLDENRRPGKMIEANDVAVERLGYSRDELLDMTIYDLMRSDQAKEAPLGGELVEKKRLLFECLHCAKDGNWVPTEVSASLFSMGGKLTVQCVCRDLTARKEAEHAVKDAYEAMERRIRVRTSELEEQIAEREEAEARLIDAHNLAESLINSSLDGILAFDHDLRYTVWNPAMEQISGIKKQDVIGRYAGDLFPFLEEIGELDHWRKVLRGKIATSKERKFSVPSTGKKGLFDAYYTPLKDRAGKIIGGLGVIRLLPEAIASPARATMK
jgi:PAS domain S-box-containing protein